LNYEVQVVGDKILIYR